MSALAKNNIMVILDNQMTTPGWCCSENDGNGFFGDKYFGPEEWLKGLSAMATMFRNTKNVMGMSLRNELRGSKNVSLWFRFVTYTLSLTFAYRSIEKAFMCDSYHWKIFVYNLFQT